ncbi:MAG: hypothetical protein ACREN6_01540 [Gemmatimonadaceae bacterium]
MKTLSTASAAAALGVEEKVLDNVLAREGRSIILPGARGRSRRIPVTVLEHLAVAFVLSRDVGVSISRGLELAERLLASGASNIQVGSLAALSFDVVRLRRTLELAIDEALESVAEHARGRPRA